MKVLIVCSRLCFGGAERVAVMWANGFANRGYDIFLATNYNEPITYKVDQQVRSLNIFPSTQNKLKKWWGALSSLRKLIKEEKPDVVIGVMSTCSMMAKLASIGTHCRVIATEHNAFERPASALFSKHDWFMKFVANRLYDAITVLTDADRQIVAKKFKHVFTLPNPLSIQPIEMVFKKKKVILAAGRLDVWHTKGFDLLIRAWGNVVSSLKLQVSKELEPETTETCNLKLETISPWRLQIAGTGSEESLRYLKQLSKENGVEDSVDFLGFRTDIEELYKQSEIFVLSSRYEGFGLVLIEAMSQGCACVACDYKGRQREIIQDDSQGLCCEPDDVEPLAESIKKMIEDEEYRKSVQLKAIERSKTYSIDNIIDRWETLLTQIVH